MMYCGILLPAGNFSIENPIFLVKLLRFSSSAGYVRNKLSKLLIKGYKI